MKEPASNILEQYKYIVDESNIVSKADLLGTITFANNKFVEASGYSLMELLGKPHSILRNPNTPSRVYKEMWDTIQAKKIWRGVLDNVRKDGSMYTVEASIHPIVDSDGEVIEYISIRHDITKLKELNRRIEILREYDMEQQYIAREKLETAIVNDMHSDECKVVYHPSDILSGDSYSIFKRNDGSIFLYLIDGQGHGISPALTVFAISTTIKQIVNSKESLEKLCKNLFPTIRTFLGEIEQLSYTMIIISSNRKRVSYASGGMYPFLIKKGDDVVKIKTNNLPFMEFSETPTVNNLDITGWESIVLYSDGMVEHEYKDINHLIPHELIVTPSLIEQTSNTIHNHEFDDDITLIHLKNSSLG